MNPVCIEIWGVQIYWYGIFFALGFLAAAVHWNRRAEKDGHAPGFGSELGIWLMISGVIGARVAYILANLPYYIENPAHILRIREGGLIFYGGFLGAAVGLILFARVHRQPLWAMADLAVSGLPLGHAFGRIGCFFNGCCYGSPSNLPWCVNVEGVCRHPTQLYETAFNLAVFVLLILFYERRRFNGRVLSLYLMTYPVGRFLLEFIRGDDRLRWLGMNMAQELSLVLFALGLASWFAFRQPVVRPDEKTNRPT